MLQEGSTLLSCRDGGNGHGNGHGRGSGHGSGSGHSSGSRHGGVCVQWYILPVTCVVRGVKY